MKNTIKTHILNFNYSIRLALILFTALLYACSPNEEESLQPEKVTFSFNLAGIAGGRVTAYDLPKGTSLDISLVDKAGNPVLTHHKINLLDIGGQYISEPLELAPGSYAVSDFMLVKESTVLYATPQKNAPLAKLVTHPLPYSFSVARNKVINVEMEVVDAQNNTPQDFGYATFDINIVHPLLISVFTKTASGIALTDASAELYAENAFNEGQHYDLGAKVNMVSFKGDVSATYILEIEKAGYKPYSKEFTYTELGGKPLKVILEQNEFTFTYGDVPTTTMDFNATGIINVDWGSGDIETFGVDFDPIPDEEQNFIFLVPQNTEVAPGTLVRVTGDLHAISSFYRDGGSALDPTQLVSLENLQLESSTTIETLNLYQNTSLTSLAIESSGALKQVWLGEHNINHLYLSNVPASNKIVKNVYQNAVEKNITGGHASVYDVVLDDDAREMLNTLRDEYQWDVFMEDVEDGE